FEEPWEPEEGAGQDLANHLHQEGLAGPLQWLQNCLRRAAQDREEDGASHPVPLVPLSEENEDAMEDPQFRRLLRQLGVRPPASEQESFWRIPAALTPQQLRHAAASIATRGPHLLERPQNPLEQTQSPAAAPSPLSPPLGAEPTPPAPCSEEEEDELQPLGRRKKIRRLEEEEEED
ncbi:TIM protein, partial [Rhinopomastus cyanomelas]|nr:TIM protein [Rhinopomastus cyanomelas]